MKLGIENRTVLITAGSQGIGRACAQAFHAEGAKVVIAARGKEALDAAAATMPGCVAIQGDVTNLDDLARIAAQAGSVDILVNNAGGPPPGPYDALSDTDWHAAVELTLMSAVRMTRAVLPHMRAQRWGRIVNISSLGVKQPVPGLSLSNSVRMAVLGWAKTLASQIGPDGITVNTVCPGWTRTARVDDIFKKQSAASGKSMAEIEAAMVEQVPLRRVGEPEDIANMTVFLASEAASYVTGTAILVDGGVVQGYS
jgi:3-oxoacyl-[acyl-carrier protein] reductase